MQWLKAIGPVNRGRMKSVEFIREDRRTQTERMKAVWWVCKLDLPQQVEEQLIEQLLHGEGLQSWTDPTERLEAAQRSEIEKELGAKSQGLIWDEMTVFG